MAKKKVNRKKKLTFADIIKGHFLNREELSPYYGLSVAILFMMIVQVYLSHLVSRKVVKINDLKERTEEYKSRNAYAESRLIKIKLESELVKAVQKDSLLPLENHPHKLLIKTDSTYGK